MSPYLFILCAEGLTTLLARAERLGHIHGVRIFRKAPPISHLLFADDSFLFFNAEEPKGKKIKEILNNYEKVPSQAINYKKSGIFFSGNVRQDLKLKIKDTLGVYSPINHGRYLGLPSFIGRNKR